MTDRDKNLEALYNIPVDLDNFEQIESICDLKLSLESSCIPKNLNESTKSTFTSQIQRLDNSLTKLTGLFVIKIAAVLGIFKRNLLLIVHLLTEERTSLASEIKRA